MTVKRVLTLVLTVVALILVESETASALPIFARRYETSCTTCHAMIPKLNPFGIAFRNNGYRIPIEDEKLLKSQDVSLGAPAWKQLWPKAVWPGKIPSVPPIAFRAALDVDVQPSQPAHLNFDFPDFIALYAAGPAGDSVSFFGSVFLIGATNTLLIDRAWAQFRLTPEKPGTNWAVFKVGRIDMRVEPFSSGYRKLTIANYNVSAFRAVSDGVRLQDRDAGVEMWGAATGPDNHGGLEYGGGIVQGTAGAPENNNFKDAYWSVAYKLGGHGVLGSRQEIENVMPTNNYAEKSIEIGTFGYRGKDITKTTVTPSEDQITRAGVKIDTYYGNLNVYGAGMVATDNIMGVTPHTINSSVFFAEADYMALPWIMPLARFEKTNYSDGRRDVEQLIPALNFSVRANVRFILEGHFFNRVSPTGARTSPDGGIARLEFLF